MNVALIFAGGVGLRMNSKSVPKQFLKINGKQIIIYTLEVFENCPEIDAICISCVESHIDFMKRLCDLYNITKVKWIVPGGTTGQLSIYNGLKCIHGNCPENSVVLVHDGVRPLIDNSLIVNNINSVHEFGSAISSAKAIETHAQIDENGYISHVACRENAVVAKAPQSFILKDIFNSHEKAMAEGKADFIDSASMMMYYGHKLHTVNCSTDNIKVTNPCDYYIVKAILDARENSQIFGI